MWNICNEITGKVKINNCESGEHELKISEEFNGHLLNTIPELLKNQINLPFQYEINDNNHSI